MGQTYRSQRGGGLEEINHRTYMHMGTARGHGQPCSEGRGRQGLGGRVKWGNGRHLLLVSMIFKGRKSIV